jgi:hypothetical protein
MIETLRHAYTHRCHSPLARSAHDFARLRYALEILRGEHADEVEAAEKPAHPRVDLAPILRAAGVRVEGAATEHA